MSDDEYDDSKKEEEKKKQEKEKQEKEKQGKILVVTKKMNYAGAGTRSLDLYLAEHRTIMADHGMVILSCEGLNPTQIQKCEPYERVFVLRLGQPQELKGPGITSVLPWIDNYWIIDQRAVVVDVPPQAVLTKDAVTVAVDAVMVYKIVDPMSAITQFEDPIHATSVIAVTSLRNELGKRNLSEVLTEREEMAAAMRGLLDELTESLGIEIRRVDIKTVSLPPLLQKVMAKEAEARRETKARVISSQGEVSTAKALIEASASMFNNPMALQLRYLQSLNAITSDKESTIVFPFPMDYIDSFQSESGPSSRKQ